MGCLPEKFINLLEQICYTTIWSNLEIVYPKNWSTSEWMKKLTFRLKDGLTDLWILTGLIYLNEFWQVFMSLCTVCTIRTESSLLRIEY